MEQTEALRLTNRSGYSFEYLFRYQYVISAKPLDLPGMHPRPLGRFVLQTGEAARVTELHDNQNRLLGYLVGVAVDPEGLLTDTRQIAGVDIDNLGTISAFEDWLDHLAGRYTIVLKIEEDHRVYADPVGMNGQCYNRKTGRVASSPFLCLDRALEPNPLYDIDKVMSGQHKISLFHTADVDVARQNPNCYLDLANFQEFRFWPRAHRFDMPVEEHAQTYDEIARTLRHNIETISATLPTAVPVTGGKDSRLLLGLMGDKARQSTKQFFSYFTNYATRRDTTIAQRLAQVVGVDLTVFSYRDTAPEEKTRFAARTRRRQHYITSGACVALRHPKFRLDPFVPKDMVVLRGHQTDLLRAVFVSFASPARWKRLSRQIRKLFLVPIEEFSEEVYLRFEPFYRTWLAGLPPVAQSRQIDFMFIEVYYTSSLGALFPAQMDHFYMSPFNSRRLIELSLRFDTQFRMDSGPVYDLLHRNCPEMDTIPFDDETGPGLDELEDESLITEPMEKRIKAVRKRATAKAARAAE